MIRMDGVRFDYGEGGFSLNIPSLHIPRGQKAAVIGPSGAGKTTLINLIAGILRPSSGVIQVADIELTRRSDSQRRAFRIAEIGFVFQEFELLDYLNVRDNVLLPFRLNGTQRLTPSVRETAQTLSESMGLASKLDRYPRRLSQGERQRVAICRALIASPSLLIADEPTGNLDPHTAQSILDVLLKQVAERGSTLIMVTHNHDLLDSFDRVIDIQDYAAGGSA